MDSVLKFIAVSSLSFAQFVRDVWKKFIEAKLRYKLLVFLFLFIFSDTIRGMVLRAIWETMLFFARF